MSIVESIVQFGLEKGFADKADHLNNENIAEEVAKIEEVIGKPLDEHNLEKYAPKILALPQAFHIFKLDIKRQIKLKKLMVKERLI